MNNTITTSDIVDADFFNGFDVIQKQRILDGILKGIDISWYADESFGYEQMKIILKGLEKGFDISWYANPKFNYHQMTLIYDGLENNLDVSYYAIPEFHPNIMSKIYDALYTFDNQRDKYSPEMLEVLELLSKRCFAVKDELFFVFDITDINK